ncbi:MAG TPA: hypothetical protein P5531_08305 [Bacteroidales bacterium]|nr:hypothetical protein [Bacteroidales bacterium]HSA43529.1 hypothetical protein [Bacteroidales bacterium]
MNPTILFIMVCYHNEHEVAAFVREQLGIFQRQSFEYVIVDNGSTRPELLEALTAGSGAFLCKPGMNLGYFGGAWAGIQYYLEMGHTSLPEIVILCNTDISFDGVDFPERLQHSIQAMKPDILGPCIISSRRGVHQNPYIPRRIPARKLRFFQEVTRNFLLYNAFLLCYYLVSLMRRGCTARMSPLEAGTYYSLHGSFLIFTSGFFQKKGHLDYGSLLYGEEIFLGEMARLQSMKVCYTPGIRIYHREHATTGLFKNRGQVKKLHESYTYLFRRFYAGTSPEQTKTK